MPCIRDLSPRLREIEIVQHPVYARAGQAMGGYGRDGECPAFSLCLPVYGKSKLCNILFTRELAKRWTDTGVTVNALHPGFVSTRFGDQSGGFFQRDRSEER